MADRNHITHIDAVTPETMDRADGWLITEFRLPFSARQGLGTTMFHARFMPGSVHKKHRHENCEEIYYLVAGSGIAGAGGGTEEVRAGHFHYVPAGTEHWLANADGDAPIEVVGWYLGAGSVAATGYRYMGDVTAADRAGPHRGYDVGALRHVADAAPAPLDGAALRAALGAAQGIGHTAWQLVLEPGETYEPRRRVDADTFCFVVSGTGRAGVGDAVAALRPGACVHVPAGATHWLTAADGGPLTIVGLFEGTGSHAASGDERPGEMPAAGR